MDICLANASRVDPAVLEAVDTMWDCQSTQVCWSLCISVSCPPAPLRPFRLCDVYFVHIRLSAVPHMPACTLCLSSLNTSALHCTIAFMHVTSPLSHVLPVCASVHCCCHMHTACIVCLQTHISAHIDVFCFSMVFSVVSAAWD